MIQKPLLIVGRNMVHDALKSDKNIEIVYVGNSSRHDQRIREIHKLAQEKGVAIQYVSPEKIRTLSNNDTNAQNVVAYMQQYEAASLKEIIEHCLQKGKDPFIVLINKIDYEQNLGAILRSCWGANVDAVVVSTNGVHEVTPIVAKVSHGGAAYVPLIGQSLFQAIDILKEYAIPLVGVEVGMGRAYDEITLLGPVAFLMGGEVAGISEPLQKKCDIFIHIPQNNELASLNVSVATALILFEKARQERAVKAKAQ